SAVYVWPLVSVGSTAPSHARTIQAHASPIKTPLVAVTLRGDIYVIPAAGGVPRRLTSYGLNSSPVLSPDGRHVAYLSTSRRYLVNGIGTTHGVWIVPTDGPPNGSAAIEITRSNPALDRGGLAWSPDGRLLAYYDGASVTISGTDGAHQTVVLRLPAPFHSATGASAIAWSPDSRRVAILASAPGSRTPSVMVADTAGKDTTATITFPPRSPGAAVIGPGLAWSADGRSLTFDTVTIGEAGGRITGIWRVAAGGGMAHLLIGQSVYSRPLAKEGGGGIVVVDPALEDATMFAVSPDDRYIVTNPLHVPTGNQPVAYRLWLLDANGTHGRALAGTSSCTLTQFAWLPMTAALAYVTECPSATTGTLVARLNSVTANGAAPRELYSLSYTAGKRGAPFNSIDLAPEARPLGA
ncbi:MAG: hypothetical protein M3Y74_06385, partial [Chloroflexota bacterium]|nr:hypothetical protein [Chloroflexota bacterium]